jgi:hypothetical protein
MDAGFENVEKVLAQMCSVKGISGLVLVKRRPDLISNQWEEMILLTSEIEPCDGDGNLEWDATSLAISVAITTLTTSSDKRLFSCFEARGDRFSDECDLTDSEESICPVYFIQMNHDPIIEAFRNGVHTDSIHDVLIANCFHSSQRSHQHSNSNQPHATQTELESS